MPSDMSLHDTYGHHAGQPPHHTHHPAPGLSPTSPCQDTSQPPRGLACSSFLSPFPPPSPSLTVLPYQSHRPSPLPQAAPPPPHCGRKRQPHEAASSQPARDKGRGERRAGGPCACTSAQAPQALARTGEQVGRGSMLLSIAALVRASDLAICLTSRVRDEARQALTSHCTSLHGKPQPHPSSHHATSRPSGAKPSTALRPQASSAHHTGAHQDQTASDASKSKSITRTPMPPHSTT